MKKIYLLLIFVFGFYGCSREQTHLPIVHSSMDVIIEESSFSELYQLSVEGLEYDPTKSYSKTRELSSLELNNNFEIDRKRVIKITTENFESYTAIIRRPEENNHFFENIVFVIKKEDAEVKSYLIKYTPTEEMKFIEAHNSYSFVGNRIVSPIIDGYPIMAGSKSLNKSSSGGCYGTYEWVCTWGGTPHPAGPNCWMANDGRISLDYIPPSDCASEPTFASGGGGETDINDEDPVITTIMYEDGTKPTASAEIENFESSLSSEEMEWVRNYSYIYNSEIIPFLEKNNFGESAKHYGRVIIRRSISGSDEELLNQKLFQQNLYNVWNNLTDAEREIITAFPIDAFHIWQNRKIAEKATVSIFGYNGHNDKSDAFRHAFYNAINTKIVGSYKAKLFSDAHESETPNALILEKEMDLFNNSVGHKSNINYPRLTVEQLAPKMLEELEAGNLRYLAPLDFNISPPFDGNRDGIQDCASCRNGITSLTSLTPTNE